MKTFINKSKSQVINTKLLFIINLHVLVKCVTYIIFSMFVDFINLDILKLFTNISGYKSYVNYSTDLLNETHNSKQNYDFP